MAAHRGPQSHCSAAAVHGTQCMEDFRDTIAAKAVKTLHSACV